MLLGLLTGCLANRGAQVPDPAAPPQTIQPQTVPEQQTVPDETSAAGTAEQTPEDIPPQTAQDGPEREEIELPDAYDYRKAGRMPAIGDQKELGTCWAFASLLALETVLLPDEQWDFSVDHMSIQNSFSLKQEDGGQYAMSMAYLLAWQGPVLEKSDPYGDGLSPKGLKPIKHVQEIRLLKSKDYRRIKEAVYTVGGVQSSLYTRMTSNTSTDQYYHEENYAYYYPGEEKANHNVVIVGWDDHYPRENFRNQPEGDGAFICANSWGTEFGEEGCIYVSYYDINIGDVNVLYSGVAETDEYTSIYQSDLCGWIGQVGYGRDSAYFANVYQAKAKENLAAVGFYATMPNTSYEVYTGSGPDTPGQLRLSAPVAAGSFADAGFYTVPLPREMPLEAGETFFVAVKITTPGAVHPVAIEYQSPDSLSQIDLSDGEGYLSPNGTQWISAEEKQMCNICLKAYTKNK